MHNHKYLKKDISQNRSFWDKFFETQSLIFLTQVDVRSNRKGVLTINNNEAITRISKIFAKNRKFTIYKSPSHNVSVGTSVTTSLFLVFGFFLFSHFASKHHGVLNPLPEFCASLVWLHTQDIVWGGSWCNAFHYHRLSQWNIVKYVNLILPWPWWTLTPFFSVTSSTSLGILWMFSSPDNDDCTTDIFQFEYGLKIPLSA